MTRVAARITGWIKQNPIAVILFAAASLVMVAFELLSYWHFQFAVLDLGMYNRHLWGLAYFDFGPNPLKGINLLADHAHYILLLLAPFYALFMSPVFLLVVQALAIAVSGWPIYRIARKFNTTPWVAALWLIPYFTYFGFWSALSFPFHAAPLSVLPIAWALCFLLEKRTWPLVISLGFMVLTKEDMPLVAIMIGLYLLLIQRKWKFGSIVIVASTAYFFLATRVLIPAFSHTKYAYDTTTIGLRATLTHPLAFLRALLLPMTKLKTVSAMLLSFGGILPFFGLDVLILLAPLWLGRFLSPEVWRWLTGEHYSANQGPIIAVAAIVGVSRLVFILDRAYGVRQKAIAAIRVAAPILCMATTVIGYGFVTERPITRFFRRSFYVQTPVEQSAWQALRKVPRNASFAVQSAFPQASSRKEIYQVPFDQTAHQPEYVLLSDSLNFWPFADAQAVRAERNRLIATGYTSVFDENGVFLLRSSPQIYWTN